MAKTKTMIYWLPFAFTVCSLTGNVLAQDLDAGKNKAEAVCQVCHGMDGQGIAYMVPHISGQRREYLVAALEAYRSGQRQHAQMSIIAQMLKDDDIQNLADWYSSIKFTIQTP